MDQERVIIDEGENDGKADQAPTKSTTLQHHHHKPTKTKSYVNKNANSEQLDLDALTHEQLLVEAKRLQTHLTQVKNILNKTTSAGGAAAAIPSVDKANKKPKKVDRPFDFSKWNKRHVLLKFAYFGWNYQGYTVQEGIPNTIENELFEAFARTKLVANRETSNYHRCGRTDKGVSAFSQVVSIDFRSNCAAASGLGVIVNDTAKMTETKYI
jgi:tRNA pseudouridine38/39 synthase